MSNLVCVTCQACCAEPLAQRITRIVAARPAAVILREKTLEPGVLKSLAVQIAGVCATHGVPFVLNGPLDLALELGCTAVHAPLPALRAATPDLRLAPLVPLSPVERDAIARVTQILRGQNAIECTACRYCVDGCPKKINIPELFSCLNAKRAYNEDSAEYYYRTTHTGNGHGLASECVGCGACERACPQHLPIRELLREVAAEFEGNDAK